MKKFSIRILSMLLAAASAVTVFASCKGSRDDDTALTTTVSSSESETPYESVHKIVENGKAEFELVRPDMAHDLIIDATVTLNKKINEKLGVKLTIKDDFAKNVSEEKLRSYREILIGETNRSETAEVLSSLPENSYAIKKVGNKVVIVGKDQNLTMLALFKFEEAILNNSEKCYEGTLLFSDEDSITVTLDKELTIPEIIRSGHEYIAETKFLFSSKSYSEAIHVAQGAASDGTYAYFVIRHSNDAGAVVYKYRLDNGEYVAESQVLQLGHGNDATYDTTTNTLVVAHGQSEGKTLTLIDPETLTVIRTVSIGQGSGAISYNAKRDMYAISQGGSTLHLLSYDYLVKKSYKRTDNSGYTAQGMGSDDDYVYFPMSGESDNRIEVYDWDGNYVTGFTVADNFESESLFCVNGKYYISYYKGASNPGAHLYELWLNIVFK